MVLRQVALLIPDATFGALAAAPLLTFPSVSCSRLHHNGAVLVGAAGHAMFPDMHISTDAGIAVRPIIHPLHANGRSPAV